MSVTIGGTFSGLNVSAIIQAVIAADSIPMTNLETPTCKSRAPISARWAPALAA